MIDISKIEWIKDKEELISNESKRFNTKYSIDQIENIINGILDKYSDFCKYYIDLENQFYCVSFNVSYDQIEAMNLTMFTINIYKDHNNSSIVIFSKEICEHHQWQGVFNDFLKKFQFY